MTAAEDVAKDRIKKSAERTARLVAKLNDPNARWTSGQVAYLMGVAAEWARDVIDGEPSPMAWRAGYDAGYQARVAEENAAYPPEPYRVVTSAGQDAVRVYRARESVDAPGPREGDFQGLGLDYVLKLRERWAM